MRQVRITTTIVILFILTMQIAFSTELDHQEKKCIHLIGLSGGINYSDMIWPDILPDFDYLMSYQFQTNYEIRTNNINNINYGLRIGVGFINRDFDIGTFQRLGEDGQVIDSYESHMSSDFIHIPINAFIHYNMFFVKAGFYSAYKFDEKLVQVGTTENIYDSEINESFDWGIDIGGGIELLLINKLRCSLGYSYQKSFESDRTFYSHLIDLGILYEL